MHMRLQAWLREHTCEDIAYLGETEDKDGEMKHLYRIGEHEVCHDMIHELVSIDSINSIHSINSINSMNSIQSIQSIKSHAKMLKRFHGMC